MATTRRKLKTEQQNEQDGQSTSSSSQTTRWGKAQRGLATRDARPLDRQDGEQKGGLMNMNEEQLARGLGWFSIGLGLAEVLTPRAIAKISGVRGNTGFIRLMGLREIAHG